MYGCNFWGLTTEENLHKIEVIQKQCLRIITLSDFNSHINHLFIEHKILKIRNVIKLQQLKLVYVFTNNLLPTDLMNLFSYRHNTHTTNLELKSSEYIKPIKYHCACLWNSFINMEVPIDANYENNKILDKVKKIFINLKVNVRNILYTCTL